MLKLEAHHLTLLQKLIAKHVPDMIVWAYGSRVTGQAHEGSDLDLVIINPKDLTKPQKNLTGLRVALEASTLPILVDVWDWACIPENFQKEISKNHIVIWEAQEKGF